MDVASHPEGAAPKSAGVCSSAGYCWENPLPSGGFLNAVWGSSPNDVYAAGDGGRVLHFDGTTWTAQTTGTDTWINAVWGSGPDDVFMVGDGGSILHRRGGAWKKEDLGDAGYYFDTVWGSGPEDVFAAGSNGVVFHYDGHVWTEQASGTIAHLQGLWGSGPKDVYAVGFTGAQSEGALMHYDGTSWDEPIPLGKSLCCVWGAGPGKVWAAGTDEKDRVALWRLSEGEWKPERVPRAGRPMSLSGINGKPVLLGFVSTTQDNNIEFGRGTIFAIEESGGLWQRRDLITVSTPIGQPNWSLWGDGQKSLFVVGWWGVAGTFEPLPAGAGASAPAAGPSAEKVFHPMTGNDALGRNLTGVWGTSPKDVIAVGAFGTMLHNDGKGWRADPAGKSHDFTGIHGSGGTVVASARGGVLLVRKKGTWKELETGTSEDLNAVWTNGEEIFAAGGHGTMVHCDAARCTKVATGVKTDLWSIWGKSPTEVYATGEKTTFLRWDGASWKMHAVPTKDGFGAVGSDGKGGVIALSFNATYRLLEGMWTRLADAGGWAISDSADGEIRAVYGGGGAPSGARLFDGKKWHDEELEMGTFDQTAGRLTGVWSSGGEVFLVGSGGTILHKKP